MSRPRTLDPSNLPDNPNPTKDPKRVHEVVDDFQNRLEFLRQSFLMGRRSGACDRVAVNQDIEKLKRALSRKRKAVVVRD